MIYILDPEGHVYVDPQTLSSVALDRAVRKFNPAIRRITGNSSRQRTAARQTWEKMKLQGFTIMEKPSALSAGETP